MTVVMSVCWFIVDQVNTWRIVGVTVLVAYAMEVFHTDPYSQHMREDIEGGNCSHKVMTPLLLVPCSLGILPAMSRKKNVTEYLKSFASSKPQVFQV